MIRQAFFFCAQFVGIYFSACRSLGCQTRSTGGCPGAQASLHVMEESIRRNRGTPPVGGDGRAIGWGARNIRNATGRLIANLFLLTFRPQEVVGHFLTHRVDGGHASADDFARTPRPTPIFCLRVPTQQECRGTDQDCDIHPHEAGEKRVVSAACSRGSALMQATLISELEQVDAFRGFVLHALRLGALNCKPCRGRLGQSESKET